MGGGVAKEDNEEINHITKALTQQIQSNHCVNMKKNTVFRVIFTLLHSQAVLPCLEFFETQLCLKKDNMRLWNLPSHNFIR